MNTYCLGYTHKKCNTCQNEKNWQLLNQLPDALRRAMQKDMASVNIDTCRLTKMGEYAEMHKTTA